MWSYMLDEVGDKGLKNERIPEDGENVEEDDALKSTDKQLVQMNWIVRPTFFGKSGWDVSRLRMRSRSAIVIIYVDKDSRGVKQGDEVLNIDQGSGPHLSSVRGQPRNFLAQGRSWNIPTAKSDNRRHSLAIGKYSTARTDDQLKGNVHLSALSWCQSHATMSLLSFGRLTFYILPCF